MAPNSPSDCCLAKSDLFSFLILFDLSLTFDTVSHCPLLEILPSLSFHTAHFLGLSASLLAPSQFLSLLPIPLSCFYQKCSSPHVLGFIPWISCLLSWHSQDNLIQSHDFKHQLYHNKSQIYIFSVGLSCEHWTGTSNCLFEICI